MTPISIFGGTGSVITLVLFLLTFVKSQNVSVLYIPDTDTTFAINLPTNSNDVNFYISSPDWYQYTAIGFGSLMAGSLMLVIYPAADDQHITVSPRLGTGDTEPAVYSGVTIELHDGTSLQNDHVVVNGTCHNCRAWQGGSLDVNTRTQSFIFALGPNLPLTSNDVSAPLRRHIGYGHFTMDTIAATGPGGIGSPNNITVNAAMAGDIHNDSDRTSTVHGILFAIIALILTPFDSIIATLLRRWPIFHIITSTALLAFVIAGVATGIQVSKEYIATQNYATGHQVLGLLTFVVMMLNLITGIIHGHILADARKREQEPPETSSMVGTVHTWVGRLVWLLMLINNGLGLQLSAQRQVFIIGYSLLAVGAVIVMLPIYWCVWRIRRKSSSPKEGEDGLHQLQNIYNHPEH